MCSLFPKLKLNVNLKFKEFSNQIRAFYHVALRRLKGIFHPKMKIVSSFTHPQVVQNGV